LILKGISDVCRCYKWCNWACEFNFGR
jgi:hypothetical protein